MTCAHSSQGIKSNLITQYLLLGCKFGAFSVRGVIWEVKWKCFSSVLQLIPSNKWRLQFKNTTFTKNLYKRSTIMHFYSVYTLRIDVVLPCIWMMLFDASSFSLWKANVNIHSIMFERWKTKAAYLLFSGRTRTATRTEDIIQERHKQIGQLVLTPCSPSLWKKLSAWTWGQLIITPGTRSHLVCAIH